MGRATYYTVIKIAVAFTREGCRDFGTVPVTIAVCTSTLRDAMDDGKPSRDAGRHVSPENVAPLNLCRCAAVLLV